MRAICLLMFVMLGVSCNNQTNEKTKIQKELNNSKLTPDYNVALNFMNEYAAFCTFKSSPLIDTT